MLKKISIITVLSIVLLSCNKVAEPVTVQSGLIEVSVDPRVELMGIVAYLAGYEEYRQNKFYLLARGKTEHFQKWKDHKAVKLMKNYRTEYGLGYNAPIDIALHLSNEKLEPIVPLEPFPEKLDYRWEKIDIDEFAEALRDFRKVTRFDSFFNSNREEYLYSIAGMEDLIDRTNIHGWLLDFFGRSDSVKHSLIVSDVVGQNSYGCSIKIKDVLHLTPVVVEAYNDGFSEIIVHEYSHGYGNYLIDAIWGDINEHVEKAFVSISDTMRYMAYSNAKIYMYETLVRATTGVFVRDKKLNGAYMDDQISQSFDWVPGLTDLLINEYQNNREKYQDLESFSPRIVDFVLEQEIEADLSK